jgi:UDP-N-acetylmuramate dehydrogenase
MKNQKLILEKTLPSIKQNIPLALYTTFKIGGAARYLFEAKTKENLIGAIKLAKKLRLPFFVLGGGSKILISDKGFKGLVIKIKNQKLKIKNDKIFTEAGATLSHLVNVALKNNLTGLEWAAGIPRATMGGAIRGNAGAFGESIGDIIKEVEVFDVRTAKIKEFSRRDCKFSYRNSIFKQNQNFVILSAKLKLKKNKKSEIERKMREYLNYRKKTQPLNLPSAGSVFKNPPGFSAGELIEKCGLKGKKIGDVKISEKHANFILNLGLGRAEDVKKLIKLIKEKVKKKFGIVLEEEIKYLGFKN